MFDLRVPLLESPHSDGALGRLPEQLFEFVRARPAADLRDGLDELEVLIGPYVAGVIEERHERHLLGACFQVTEIVPAGHDVLRHPAGRRFRRSSIPATSRSPS